MLGPEKIARLTLQEVDLTLKSSECMRRDTIRLRDDPERYLRKQRDRVQGLRDLLAREEAALEQLLYRQEHANEVIDEYDEKIVDYRMARVMVERRGILERMREMRRAYMAMGGSDPASVSEDSIVS